jgi:hypothetical protein
MHGARKCPTLFEEPKWEGKISAITVLILRTTTINENTESGHGEAIFTHRNYNHNT